VFIKLNHATILYYNVYMILYHAVLYYNTLYYIYLYICVIFKLYTLTYIMLH